MSRSPTVALFVTCAVDQVTPDVGVAAVRLLEAAGARVEFPEAQTCCGQPAVGAGEPEAAARVARHLVDVFAGYDAVVAPSGSCVATVHHWLTRLLPDDARVAALADRTHELTSYLVDELGVTDVGARLATTVTVHDACHGLRNLGIRDAPRALLAAAGATVVEMDEPDTCCGFGGTFSLTHPEYATPLADDKLRRAAGTNARWLASGDTACLLHLEGRRRRLGAAGPEPVHVATLLRERSPVTGDHGIVTPGATLADRASAAVADEGLQTALRNLDIRRHTADEVAATSPGLKDRAAAIRRETLGDLDGWVERTSTTLRAVGATVHRADTPADVGRIVVDIARAAGATRAIKSKSMATEEVDLVAVLGAAGIGAVETDLGEYIVQVAHERPSHMIVPAIHKTVGQIASLLTDVSGEDIPSDHEAITAWARDRLRTEFLAGDLGITGANFVAADTGTIVLVTNEGNADLCTLIPRVHVAVVPVEKVIPRFADLATLLPVLTRSATGQDVSNYLTMVTGPRRAGEIDGPEELHVVFLDHGRLRLVGTDYEDMLACIRCGACLNVCPVFRRISGHAYDSVYTGPMGKILTPLLDESGVDGRELPGASSLCGTCAEACPVEIPLPDLLVRLRADLRAPGGVRPRAVVSRGPAYDVDSERVRHRRGGEGYPTATGDAPLVGSGRPSRAWTVWAATWSDPRRYRWSARAIALGARALGTEWTRRRVPGAAAWQGTRDLPLPATRSFRDRWRHRQGEQW